jgi:hypothetical protein
MTGVNHPWAVDPSSTGSSPGASYQLCCRTTWADHLLLTDRIVFKAFYKKNSSFTNNLTVERNLGLRLVPCRIKYFKFHSPDILKWFTPSRSHKNTKF